MRTLTNWLIGLFCIGVILLMYFFATNLPFNDGSGVADAEYFSWYGTFISGMVGTAFTIGSFIILYTSFREQARQFRITLMNQRRADDLQIFEKRFYEMVQIHRDNVSEIEMTRFTGTRHINRSETIESVSGRKVFKLIFDDFESLKAETSHLFSQSDPALVYQPVYLAQLQKNEVYTEREIDYLLLAKYDLLYLILFFGIGKSGKAIATEYLSVRYLPAYYEPVIDLAAMKPSPESHYFDEWKAFNKLSATERSFLVFLFYNNHDPKAAQDRYPQFTITGYPHLNHYADKKYFKFPFDKYYGGHQFRLGHYFRHLFQAVKFVDATVFHPTSSIQNAQEQYNYVKFLRAQLSTYEQILLAINNFSALGRAWELERNGGQAPPINERFISKYNLVRNIPTLVLQDDLQLKELYPLVDFEVINDQAIATLRLEKGYAN